MTDTEKNKEALKQSIEQNEAHLKEALGTLKHSLKTEVQVGPRVARAPYRVLGAALAIGFVLGILPQPSVLPSANN